MLRDPYAPDGTIDRAAAVAWAAHGAGLLGPLAVFASGLVTRRRGGGLRAIVAFDACVALLFAAALAWPDARGILLGTAPAIQASHADAVHQLAMRAVLGGLGVAALYAIVAVWRRSGPPAIFFGILALGAGLFTGLGALSSALTPLAQIGLQQAIFAGIGMAAYRVPHAADSPVEAPWSSRTLVAPLLVLLGGWVIRGVVLSAALSALAGWGVPEDAPVQEAIDALTRQSTPLALLAITVGAAVSEELLFRGALLHWLRRHLGDARAVFLSAVIFGCAHADRGFMAPVLIAFGGVLGTVVVRTGKLWLSMLIHATWNGLALTVALSAG